MHKVAQEKFDYLNKPIVFLDNFGDNELNFSL